MIPRDIIKQPSCYLSPSLFLYIDLSHPTPFLQLPSFHYHLYLSISPQVHPELSVPLYFFDF